MTKEKLLRIISAIDRAARFLAGKPIFGASTIADELFEAKAILQKWVDEEGWPV